MPDSKLTVRLPEKLKREIDKAVKVRKAEYRKFSLNDWMVESAQEKLAKGDKQ